MPARLLAPIALVAAVVIAVVVFTGGGGDHKVRASFDSVVQLAPGQEVRMAGRKVGEIGEIKLSDGRAITELKITDDTIWPLRRGSMAGPRWGSTTSLAYRYVEIFPGPKTAPEIKDNGVLPARSTRSAVELDAAYRIFRGRTRQDLRDVVGEAGETLDGQGTALRDGLEQAGPGLDATASLLREFGADEEALRTLVRSGARATSALAARQSDITGLVENAAATFDEFAEHTRAEQVSLERAPGAFRESTTTLRRLDSSLDRTSGDARPTSRPARASCARSPSRRVPRSPSCAPSSRSPAARCAPAPRRPPG